MIGASGLVGVRDRGAIVLRRAARFARGAGGGDGDDDDDDGGDEGGEGDDSGEGGRSGDEGGEVVRVEAYCAPNRDNDDMGKAGAGAEDDNKLEGGTTIGGTGAVRFGGCGLVISARRLISRVPVRWNPMTIQLYTSR